MYGHEPITQGPISISLSNICTVYCHWPIIIGPNSWQCTAIDTKLWGLVYTSARQEGWGLCGVLALLFGCIPRFLGSPWGNISAECYMASSTSSNNHFPLPKVGPHQSRTIKTGSTHMRAVEKQSWLTH